MPNSKVPSIVKGPSGEYRIKVDARAIGGKANERLIELVAAHFSVPKSHVKIIRGISSKNKVLEIT